MRVLVVSPYPPRRCGVGAYAAAEVERLRGEGHGVTVLSPPDGDGELRASFLGGEALRAAARLGADYDLVIVQFQPTLYHPPRRVLRKLSASLSLLWLALRRRNVEIVVHEADPPALWRPDHLLLAAAFRAAATLRFHTRGEWQSLQRQYRVRVRGTVAEHRRGVRLAHRPRREEARQRLGLPPGEPVFVCAGFLHPDKGLERAVAAFARLGAGSLHIVGSVRERTPRNLAYASRLRALCERTAGVELHEGYVADEELDAWVAAADAVVVPYRRSWSSGILARAQVHGTPAVVARVGGLSEQASERDVVFDTDGELEEALRRLVPAAARGGTG